MDDGGDVYGRANEPQFVQRKELIGRYFIERTRLPKGSKVLDVGCAEGIVCRQLASAGYDAHGIEPSSPMVNYAKHVLGLSNILNEGYAVSSYPPGMFDGMISHHVLEHVTDLKAFFVAVGTHLRHGGCLLLQTPCIDGMQNDTDCGRVLFGGHLYGFSERFLRQIMENVGLEVLECRRTPGSLSELSAEDRVPELEKSAWGDELHGISVFAERR
jgi:2-polyprenyl-3-methyl-5-hydroxy-6-metoxy-1,4-benzoquinol methylase